VDMSARDEGKHEMLAGQCYELGRPLVRTEQGSRPRPGFCLALELSDDCVGLLAEQD